MPVLRLENITKRFGNLVANGAISLSLDEGEILALLGENGAGKSTLMNILFGHYVADEGVVEVNGEALPPGSTDAAIAAGIGMVHQHFTLADNLTVLENITLGTEPLWSWRQDSKSARGKLLKMSTEFGLAVDPNAEVGHLSVGERQRVEILKALYRDARILILDEPTAVLTPQEADDLFATLRRLAEGGLSVIFISHKLHEILGISNRVAVLRRGEIVGEIETARADRAMLAEMMVGEKVTRPQLQKMPPGKPVIRLSGVSAKAATGGPGLVDVDLEIRAHEIVGIAGVAGNGQASIASLLSGLLEPSAGTIELHGNRLAKTTPNDMVRLGVGRIPEDRHKSGIVGEMPIWENLMSEDVASPELSSMGVFISKSRAVQRAEGLISQFDIRCQGPEAETRLLSGGNIQKLILARVLSPEPGIILANQPVRGLDEGAIAYVQEQLLAARQRGAAILLISEDLDELLALSDRIAVIFHGRLSESFDPQERSVAEIGLLMAGHSTQPPPIAEAARAD